MEAPTEEAELPIGATEIQGRDLVIFTPEGSCVVIPNVAEFIKSNGAEALMVDANDHIHLLKNGLKKNTMAWVCQTDN